MPTMEIHQQHTAVVEQELQAYEEKWRVSALYKEKEEEEREEEERRRREADRLRAKRRPFERLLEFGILVFEELEDLNACWRESVFRSIVEFAKKDDEAVRRFYERWLKVCEDDWMRQRLNYFSKQSANFGQEFRIAETFRVCCIKAKDTLKGWHPPCKAIAVIHHAEDLTQEEVVRLQDIAASGKAKLKIEPRAIR